jgi:hypothetical protein
VKYADTQFIKNGGIEEGKVAHAPYIKREK